MIDTNDSKRVMTLVHWPILRDALALSDMQEKAALRYFFERGVLTQSAEGTWCVTKYGSLWLSKALQFIDKPIVYLLSIAAHIYDILSALKDNPAPLELLVTSLPTSTQITPSDLYFIGKQGMATYNARTRMYSITEFGAAIVQLERIRRCSIISDE